MSGTPPAAQLTQGVQPLPQKLRNPWEEIEELYQDTVRRAKNAFTFNLITNIVIVAVGVSLVVSSILYTWVRGVDVISAGIAGIGVVDFVLVFFIGPQTYVEDAVENLARIQFVYRSWVFELGGVSYYGSRQQDSADINNVRATVQLMEELTTNAIRQLRIKSAGEAEGVDSAPRGGGAPKAPHDQSAKGQST